MGSSNKGHPTHYVGPEMGKTHRGGQVTRLDSSQEHRHAPSRINMRSLEATGSLALRIAYAESLARPNLASC
jgi:hypothetical protein